MSMKCSRVDLTVMAMVGLLGTPSGQAALVSLIFEGTTLASDGPFVAGNPFSVELTYDTSVPKSYPVGSDDSGSWYQSVVSTLDFNYNHGAYVGGSASADLMIFHGLAYGGSLLDGFWVTGINGEGFPAIGAAPFSRVNSAFGVQAPYGAAFTDSSLPVFLTTPPFESWRFEFVWVSYSSPVVQFNGFVNSVTMVPEPSAEALLIAALVVGGMLRNAKPRDLPHAARNVERSALRSALLMR